MRKVGALLVILAIVWIVYLCSLAVRSFADALHRSTAETAATIDSIRNPVPVNDHQPLEAPR